MSVAEKFRRDKEVFPWIERQVRADQPFVAMKVRHVVRRQENHVVFGGVEMAIRSVNDNGFGKRDAALGLEVWDYKLVAVALDFWLLVANGDLVVSLLGKHRANGEL